MKPSCWPAAPLHSVSQKWALQPWGDAERPSRNLFVQESFSNLLELGCQCSGSSSLNFPLVLAKSSSAHSFPAPVTITGGFIKSWSSRNGLVLLPLALSHRISAPLVCLHPISPWHCTVPAQIPSSPAQSPNYNPNSLHTSAWSTKNSTQVGKSLNSCFRAEPTAVPKLKSQQRLGYLRAVPNHRITSTHSPVSGSHLGQATPKERTEVDVQVQSGARQQRELHKHPQPKDSSVHLQHWTFPLPCSRKGRHGHSSKSTLFL